LHPLAFGVRQPSGCKPTDALAGRGIEFQEMTFIAIGHDGVEFNRFGSNRIKSNQIDCER
jgi:hypothetical protein